MSTINFVRRLWLFCLSLLLLAACTPIAPPPPQQLSAPIRNAMSAAPLSIAQNATILGWPTEAGGGMTVLREGTNGWTCVPDDPSSPTNDPMCLDRMWVAWLEAYMTGSEPQFTSVGLAYMLQGGSGASSSDPTATAPPPGQEWLIVPPHMMIVSPQPFDQTLFSTDPASGGPFVVWAGTPYEHLVIPVQDSSR
ncbi:MAG: hypothetical protein KJZ86_25780 [Caldilineaceae bacterium]|nr:hypothetical protein [Caldilineaceae bacterium]